MTSTMLESPITFNNVNNIFDEYSFKPRRKESIFLKYLVSNTLPGDDFVNSTTALNTSDTKSMDDSNSVSNMTSTTNTSIDSIQNNIDKKRRKRGLETDDEEVNISEHDETITVNGDASLDTFDETDRQTPEPLARKEIKRRKNIDFLFHDVPYLYHPQPYSYTYPQLPIPGKLGVTRMPLTRSVSLTALPSTSSSISVVVPSTTPNPSLSPTLPSNVSSAKKKKITPSSYPLIPISERQQEQQLMALTSPSLMRKASMKTPKKEEEEDSNGVNMSFDGDMKLSELAETLVTPQPVRRRAPEMAMMDEMSPSPQPETNFAERIIECLKALGGKATGAEITQWIANKYDDLAATKKKLGYTVNAVLSSKKHHTVFAKESVIIDGNKRAMWKLIDETGMYSMPEKPMKAPSSRLDKKSRSKTDLFDDEIMDESSTDVYAHDHMSDEELDKDEDWIDEGSSRRRRLLQTNPFDHPLRAGDSTSPSYREGDSGKILEEQGSQVVNALEMPIESNLTKTLQDNAPLISNPEINLGDKARDRPELHMMDKGIKLEHHDESQYTSTLHHSEVSLEEMNKKHLKAPLSRRRKSGSFHDDGSNDSWSPSDLRNEEMREMEDDNISLDNSMDKVDRSTETSESSDGSSDSEDVEDSKDSMLDKEIKVSEDERMEDEEKKVKRGVGRPRGSRTRVSKRSKGDEEIFEFGDPEIDLEGFLYEDKPRKRGEERRRSKGKSRGRKGRKKREELEPELFGESEDSEIKYDDTDESEGSTYTQMIINALRALGGRGTGTEITTYIDENYSDILQSKTSTWKNSVMGCLSANRRNVFSKEPVKEYAKRYVWVLNEGKNNTVVPTEEKKVSKRKKKEKNDDMLSSDAMIKAELPEMVESLPVLEKPPSQPLPPPPPVHEEVKQEYTKDYDLDLDAIFEDDFDNEDLDDESEDDYETTKKSQPAPVTTTNVTPTFNSSRKGRCDNAVDLITEALKDMGGSATGVQITDWLAIHYKDQLGSDKKKLGYTVNAVLSSKKYKGKFLKEKMVQGGARALWRLATPTKKGKTH